MKSIDTIIVINMQTLVGSILRSRPANKSFLFLQNDFSDSRQSSLVLSHFLKTAQ